MAHSETACRIAAAAVGPYAPQQIGVLDALGDGPKAMGELLHEYSAGYKTGVIDELVRLKLVTRGSMPGDRRVVLCSLTSKGQAEIERVWRETRAVLAEVSEELAP